MSAKWSGLAKIMSWNLSIPELRKLCLIVLLAYSRVNPKAAKAFIAYYYMDDNDAFDLIGSSKYNFTTRIREVIETNLILNSRTIEDYLLEYDDYTEDDLIKWIEES
jgi:ABC-type Fe3+ transport system substrate-binding protein